MKAVALVTAAVLVVIGIGVGVVAGTTGGISTLAQVDEQVLHDWQQVRAEGIDLCVIDGLGGKLDLVVANLTPWQASRLDGLFGAQYIAIQDGSCPVPAALVVGDWARGSHTETIVYEAFTASGKPAIHVTKTVRGYCWEGSLAANRNDAWRCLSGSGLYDPCFSSSKASRFVLCVSVPWTTSGVELKLTKRLPKAYGNTGKPSTKGLPWGVKTSSGLKCVLATGGTAAIGDVRANYGCENSNEWLWGAPSRKSQPWNIYIAPLNAKKLSKRAKIAVAWF